jgi:hypothetical protein
MKSAILAATAVLALSAASAAHAEKWYYYPVPGGALAYEDDNRKIDISQGLYGGDTLVYYFVPKALGAKSFSVIVQRMEFDCRGQRYQTLGTAYFDEQGVSLGQLDPGDWAPVPPGTPASVFRRIFCTNEKPPIAKEAPDKATLMAALRALPPTSTGGKFAPPPSSITLPAPTPQP